MLLTVDDFISQFGAGKAKSQPFDGYLPTTLASTAFSCLNGSFSRSGHSQALPSLPSGITAYIPTSFSSISSLITEIMMGKLVNLGSYDISGSGNFTDGSAMPTVTELGVSRACGSPIFAEVTTALSFTSTCTLTVTYTPEGGGSASTPAVSLTTGWLVRQGGYFALNTGDNFVTDITSVARGGTPGSPAGVVQFWGFIPLVMMPLQIAQCNYVENLLCGGMSPYRLGAGDVLGVFSSLVSGRRVLSKITLVGDN